MRKALFFIFIIVIMISCSSNDIERCVVSGMVYDSNNEGINGVQVLIDDRIIAETDVYGHFVLDKSIVENEVIFGFHKKGYEKKNVSVSSISPSSLIYVRLRSFEEIINSALSFMDLEDFHKSQDLLDCLMDTDYDQNFLHYLQAIIFFRMNEVEHCLAELEKMEIDDNSRNWVSILKSRCIKRMN